jgi:Polyketide cyclase / dehydrase and lipid transport
LLTSVPKATLRNTFKERNVAEVSSTPTSQTVRVTVEGTPEELFALLSDPAAHASIDGSNMVKGTQTPDRISAVGEVFVVDMYVEAIGDYQVGNHVVAFEEGRIIAWAPGGVGRDPVGYQWSWELIAEDDGTTTVVHAYDWSGVTDPEMLARITFPRVSPEQMESSVQNLAAAAKG